jgi:hypothetical protein
VCSSDLATDDAGAGGHVQIMKLATSTDGSATVIPASTTDGLLVNLGTNNDITGTVTANLAAGTNNIGDVDVLTLPALVAGTAFVGKVQITDGTNDAVVDTVHGDAESNTENHLDVAAKLQGYNGTTWDRLRTDTTNGLDVDVTRVIPGTTTTALGKAEDAGHTDADTGVMVLGVRNYAGAGTDGDYSAIRVNSEGMPEVVPRSNLVRVSVTSGGLTTSVTSYTAGDQVGTQFTIAGAARASGGYGWIRSVVLQDLQDIIGAYEVAFFRASVTPAADNAAFSISTTDVLQLVALVPLNGAYDIGATRVAQAHSLAIPYDCSGGTSLYACLQTKGAHTFFSGGVTQLRLVVQLELA